MSQKNIPFISSDLRIFINDQEYDLTNWQNHHPGGKRILQQYHQKDATEIFTAFHSEETMQDLNKRPSKKVEIPPDQVLLDFRKLRQKLIDEGYFKINYSWYLYKISTTYLFFFLSMILLMKGHWLISAVSLGIFYQQAGWLGHDFCHHQAFKNRKLNNFFSYITGNLLSGFSVNWWKDRHNTHHSITNVMEGDPDIDNLPLFAWTEKDIPRAKDYPLADFIVPYQHYYFLIFTPFLKFIWCYQSIKFVMDENLMNNSYKKSRMAEKATLGLHWLIIIGMLVVFAPVKAWLLFLLLSEFIGGAGIALIVFMNHYALEKLTNEEGKKANFISIQLETTKNINPGIITDWICGGLNYQIEHHLMPTIPRHNLSKVRPYIMKFCEDHKLPYYTNDFIGCVKDLEDVLFKVATAYTKARIDPLKKQN